MSLTERQLLEQSIRAGRSTPHISPALLLNDKHHQLSPLVSSESKSFRDDVTVVIPTHRHLPWGLHQFAAQALVEVLVNGAVEVPTLDSVRFHRVNWEGHGKTRASAVQNISTPYVLFSVDDAVPLPGCVDALVSAIEHNTCDAVIARQIPFPTAERFTCAQLANWTPHASTVYEVSQTDHVATLYRTQTLLDHPIPLVPIAEDAWWSQGKLVLCEPKAVVVHSHPRHTKAIVEREFQIHRQLKMCVGSDANISFSKAFLGAVSAVPQYGVKEGGRVLAQNLARFAAHKL